MLDTLKLKTKQPVIMEINSKREMFHLLMISLKVLCVTLIIAQPVYSHPHNIMPRNDPSSAGSAQFMHMFDRAHFAHQLVSKRQASDVAANNEYCQVQEIDIVCSSGYYQLIDDAYLNCGQVNPARHFATLCVQNEMGEYCQISLQ